MLVIKFLFLKRQQDNLITIRFPLLLCDTGDSHAILATNQPSLKFAISIFKHFDITENSHIQWSNQLHYEKKTYT